MGSALRTRFRFDSLGGIREAYALAFSKNYDAIDVALGDKAIDALAAVRNVLVHRSGLADDTYVRQCEFLPIPRTSLGDQVKLDGTIVANLLMASFRKQLDLTSAVDNWVRSN
jgi:hypothetical protein